MSEHPTWLLGARTAPSAHNTQPWRFRPLRRGRVEVGWDPRRALPAADPTSRDLFLALGAAVETARVRAAVDGKRLTFTPVDSGDCTVGYLEPETDPPSEDDVLLAPFLDVRQTARTPHLRRPVPAAVLNGLSEEAERGGRRLRIVSERRAVRHLARLARLATPSMARADLLDTGRVLLRLWLIAARSGLSTHPVSALLDCVETIRPAAARFREPAETAAALFRLGATSPVARAPRLPVEELIQESGADHAHD